jgi:hypothetical protein
MNSVLDNPHLQIQSSFVPSNLFWLRWPWHQRIYCLEKCWRLVILIDQEFLHFCLNTTSMTQEVEGREKEDVRGAGDGGRALWCLYNNIDPTIMDPPS